MPFGVGGLLGDAQCITKSRPYENRIAGYIFSSLSFPYYTSSVFYHASLTNSQKGEENDCVSNARRSLPIRALNLFLGWYLMWWHGVPGGFGGFLMLLWPK